MSHTRLVIIMTCIIVILRQIRPFASYSFTSSFHSVFFQERSSNTEFEKVHASSVSFVWIIAPLFVLLFPTPDSFRCKSVLVYGAILELFRSGLFYFSVENSCIENALPQVSPIFEVFFSTTTIMYCVYLYTEINDKILHQKIALYVCASVFLGACINTFYHNISSNLKLTSEICSNCLAMPVIALMVFVLIPQRYREKDIKKDPEASFRFLNEQENESEREPILMKLWNDFKDIFKFKDVQKWSLCWWLTDTLQIGMTQDFANFLLPGVGLLHNTNRIMKWCSVMDSIALMLSALSIVFLAHTKILWKIYINWFVCIAPVYYITWGFIQGTPPFWFLSFFYILCGIINRITFAISLSQLAKYVPSKKHVIVFAFNSMISLALKVVFQKSSEVLFFTDSIFKISLIIMVAFVGKSMLNSIMKKYPKNMEAW